MDRYLIMLRAEYITDAQYANVAEYPELIGDDDTIDWGLAHQGRRAMLDIEGPMLLDVIEAEDSDSAIVDYLERNENMCLEQVFAIKVDPTCTFEID